MRTIAASTGTELSSMLPDSDEAYQEALNKREPVDGREGIDCQVCGNHEYVWVVKDGERFCRDCECKARRDSMARIRRSGLSEQMQRCTFASYQTPQAWQKNAKETVLRFVRDKNRRWLLLSGQPGSGKSHLCTAAAGKFLRAGADVRYMRWTEESVLLKAAVNDEAEYTRRLSPLKKCKVLYIDDFFKTQKGQQPSPADVRLAFDLLDYRYCNRGLITMISTERSALELLDIDAAVGSRIYEMTKGYQLQFDGKDNNWRLNH